MDDTSVQPVDSAGLRPVATASTADGDNVDLTTPANQAIDDDRGLKIVKSILKPPSKSQQPSTESILQKWFKSSTTTTGTSSTSTSSIGGKTQQEILSSINASKTVATSTSLSIAADAAADFTTMTKTTMIDDSQKHQSAVTSNELTDLELELDIALSDSFLGEPSDMATGDRGLLGLPVIPVNPVETETNTAEQQPTTLDIVQKQSQRLKKIASKTLLSQQYRPMDAKTDVATKMTSAPTLPHTSAGGNSDRPPTEVTISTPPRKIPKKKAAKAKHSVTVPIAKKATTNSLTQNKGTGQKGSGKIASVATDNSPIWEGVPSDVVTFDVDWSKGWAKRTFRRKSGLSKGSTDSYWYTPQKQYKLRSLKEVERFVRFCAESSNDEVVAYQKFKGK